jgi:signal transduction histidine kinase
MNSAGQVMHSRRRLFRLARLVRVSAKRLVRRVALSRLFLAISVIVVAIMMLALGSWMGAYLTATISRGIAETAASRFDSAVANRLGPKGPVSMSDAAELDLIFRIGNEAEFTRLLQIRILDLDGAVIYESFAGILGEDSPADFAKAAGGVTTSRVINKPLVAIGPLDSGVLPILEIHTPLHHPATGKIFAVADLDYSAQSLITVQRDAQLTVWTLVAAAGLGVIVALYAFVAQISRTLAHQDRRLAQNLEASRRLAEENHVLHAASERLRVDAALTNESLLAGVGSDLHDGPIQLLTLVILRLSKLARDARSDPSLAENVRQSLQLATGAMEELRNISSGLVLPELADLTLEETISLAIVRHESSTGRHVHRTVGPLSGEAPMMVKICTYRIIQEALNNAYWHGDTSAPGVTADAEDGRLRLEIVNGTALRALDKDADRDDAASLGLRSMRFRVEALRGHLHVGLGSSARAAIGAEIPLDGGVAQRFLPEGDKIGVS